MKFHKLFFISLLNLSIFATFCMAQNEQPQLNNIPQNILTSFQEEIFKSVKNSDLKKFNALMNKEILDVNLVDPKTSKSLLLTSLMQVEDIFNNDSIYRNISLATAIITGFASAMALTTCYQITMEEWEWDPTEKKGHTNKQKAITDMKNRGEILFLATLGIPSIIALYKFSKLRIKLSNAIEISRILLNNLKIKITDEEIEFCKAHQLPEKVRDAMLEVLNKKRKF